MQVLYNKVYNNIEAENGSGLKTFRYNTAFRLPFALPTQFFLFSSTIILLYDEVGQQRLNIFPSFLAKFNLWHVIIVQISNQNYY